MSKKYRLPQYKKLLDQAETLIFPLELGGVSFFTIIPKQRILTLLQDWNAEDFNPIECGWKENNPNTKTLVHYDGWSL